MAGADPTARELPLAAELFLVAIDPSTGRLVKGRRRRFRKALARSSGSTGIAAGSRARRAAIGELRRRGLIERSLLPGRFVVVPRSGASAPFARLTRGIAAGEFQQPRDVRLFVLASWTGVLWKRLSRSERRSAARRLKSMLAAPAARDSEFAPIPPMAAAIGQVAYREEMDVLRDIVGDVLSGDEISVDHISGAESGGGFDASGGSDGGH